MCIDFFSEIISNAYKNKDYIAVIKFFKNIEKACEFTYIDVYCDVNKCYMIMKCPSRLLKNITVYHIDVEYEINNVNVLKDMILKIVNNNYYVNLIHCNKKYLIYLNNDEIIFKVIDASYSYESSILLCNQKTIDACKTLEVLESI